MANPVRPGPVTLSETSEELIYALVDLTLGLAAQTEAVITDLMAELGLTHPLAHAVWQLDPTATAPSMRELAAKLRCDPSTVTFLADRLEAKKLLTRRVHPTNRRVKTLQLTARGRRARASLVKAMTTRSPIARLTAEDQHQLHHLLAKTVNARPASKNVEGMHVDGVVVSS